MISGFTDPLNEFVTPYRVINHHAGNSCRNNPRHRFDHKDFLWRPRHAPRARLLYSVADFHWLRLYRQAQGERDIAVMAERRRMRRREFEAAAFADAVVTHSRFEAQWLRRHAPAQKIHVAPRRVEPRPRRVPRAMTPSVAEDLDLPPALAGAVTPDGEALAALICRPHDEEAENERCAAAGLDFVANCLSPARIDALMRRATGEHAPARNAAAIPSGKAHRR